MTFEEVQVKWSVTLTDRLGPEMLTVLEIKGQVLHRVRFQIFHGGNSTFINSFDKTKFLF